MKKKSRKTKWKEKVKNKWGVKEERNKEIERQLTRNGRK